jgi:two-component system cell cycle response regulator DivK
MRQATVLYVEDNEYNRKIVRQLLTKTTYRLREAVDGEAALGMVREERPDLILMDVQLPKMSGLDVTRALRLDPATADVPIIVVTSFALSGDDKRALAAGASAYIAKPYSPRELLALINTFLAEGSAPARRSPP